MPSLPEPDYRRGTQRIHVCPCAPLARLELRVVLEELLALTRWIEPHPERSPERAKYPASGFATLPLRIR